MIIFFLYREDSISKAADEVIDEINVSDEEIKEQTHESSKRRIKSKKNNQSDLIDLMRKSISIGNKSNPTININFENLNEAKGVIVSVEVHFTPIDQTRGPRNSSRVSLGSA
jgi:hypothetical protein